MEFFTGLHHPSAAKHFHRCMVSFNRLRDRKKDFAVGEWILDSGGFTQVLQHGEFLESVAEYAQQIARWARCGSLLAAVTQDYMCAPAVLERTGYTLREHQTRTVQRFDALRALAPACVYLMPVLQGDRPADYVQHLADYGARLARGCWVGVGNIAARQTDLELMRSILVSIHKVRPDLRLHGFGLKITSLQDFLVRSLLATADSMAWSYAARKAGRSANDWREADAFRRHVEGIRLQQPLFDLGRLLTGEESIYGNENANTHDPPTRDAGGRTQPDHLDDLEQH